MLLYYWNLQTKPKKLQMGYYKGYFPFIFDISGALFTLSLTLLKLNSQYEEGARDINNIRIPEIILWWIWIWKTQKIFFFRMEWLKKKYLFMTTYAVTIYFIPLALNTTYRKLLDSRLKLIARNISGRVYSQQWTSISCISFWKNPSKLLKRNEHHWERYFSLDAMLENVLS